MSATKKISDKLAPAMERYVVEKLLHATSWGNQSQNDLRKQVQKAVEKATQEVKSNSKAKK